MLDVKANFPRKYRRTVIKCNSCKQMRSVDNNGVPSTMSNISDSSSPAESQYHLMFDCLAFKELRHNYDLTEDCQIVSFFKEVLSHRDEIEDEEED